jgi:hypothetical protein
VIAAAYITRSAPIVPFFERAAVLHAAASGSSGDVGGDAKHSASRLSPFESGQSRKDAGRNCRSRRSMLDSSR